MPTHTMPHALMQDLEIYKNMQWRQEWLMKYLLVSQWHACVLPVRQGVVCTSQG